MDYAIVNAGMCLKVDDKNGNIDTLRFCVGNIEDKPCSLDKVSGLAKGKYVDIMNHPNKCCDVRFIYIYLLTTDISMLTIHLELPQER